MKNLLFALAILCLPACSDTLDKQLERALKLSGKNRVELESVLDHYRNDSLKLESARFLNRNMPFHFSNEEFYISPKGEKYRPDLSLFRNKDEVARHCDSLVRIGYTISKSKVFDIKTLSSSFLIGNIELAFKVWEKPWARQISFDDFCRYILPYRAQTEEVSLLRKELMERFTPILDSANVKTPLEACKLLNEQLKKVVRYGETGLSFYPTIDETYRIGYSQCDGMANLGAFIMRAAGIPVAVDFTIWNKMDLGHSWCVVLDRNRFYSFGPGEDQPEVHAKLFAQYRHRRPAKVYRSRFDAANSRAIADDGYRTFLKNPLFYDVTDEYLDRPIRIEIPVDPQVSPPAGKSATAYLCTYNFYSWKPISVGTRSKQAFTFNKVVGDNIFIVMDSPDGTNLRVLTPPFYVGINGDVSMLIPSLQKRKSYFFPRYKNGHSDSYALYYWDVREKGFVSIQPAQVTDSAQFYNRIPENSLLWYASARKIYNQRIFVFKGDSILYY